jgi:hypothetical protein
MTEGWTRTIWSEARQIGALLRWPREPGDDAAPHAFFETLRAEGRSREAAMFLGQALPRYEAVLWAARAAEHHAAEADSHAMAAVRTWLREPSDLHRRAAHDAARQIRWPTAAQLCALAVYTSGGSLASDDRPPFPAPKDAAGRFAAGAVLIAAADSPAHEQVLDQALDFGSRIASSEPEGKA